MAVDSQLPQERQRKQQRMQQVSQALDGSGVTQVGYPSAQLTVLLPMQPVKTGNFRLALRLHT